MQKLKTLLIKVVLPILGVAAVAAGGLYFVTPTRFHQLLPGISTAKLFSNLKPAESANFVYVPPVLKEYIKINGTFFADPSKYSKVQVSFKAADLIKHTSKGSSLPIQIKDIDLAIIANSQNLYIKLFVAPRNVLEAELRKNSQGQSSMLSTYLDPALSVLSGEKYLRISQADMQKYNKQNIDYAKMLSPKAYVDLMRLVYKSLDASKPQKTSLDKQQVYKVSIHLVKDKVLAALREAKSNSALLKELNLTVAQVDQLIAKVEATDAKDIESLYLDLYFARKGQNFYITGIAPSLKLNNKQKASMQKSIQKLTSDTSPEAQEIKVYLEKSLKSGMLNLGLLKYTDINKVTTTINAPAPDKTVNLEQIIRSLFYYMMLTNNSPRPQGASSLGPRTTPSIPSMPGIH